MNMQNKGIQITKRSLLFFFLLFVSSFLFLEQSGAEVLERVVAIVNDDVILLTEFEEEMQAAEKTEKGVEEEVVLNLMIDKLLILGEARKIEFDRRGVYTDTIDIDKVVNSYLQNRIKVLIHIPFETINSYYSNNIDRYGNSEFSEVKDEIEAYLLEREFQIKIREHINELRKKSFIRVQL